MASSIPIETEVPIDRFRRDLDSVAAPDMRIGLAVSGGPDSMALLLLAAEARPGQIEAATVDHALRAESRAEAELVAECCKDLEVRHRILTVTWDERPGSGLQERARAERYGLLNQWAKERGLGAVATAHHLDDQAETFLMRLARGAGVRGLAGMRKLARVPGGDLPLLRPLLDWRHSELEAVCAAAGIEPARDPSNEDERFERVRVRKALGDADWLNPSAIVRSAVHLEEAETALEWAADREWGCGVTEVSRNFIYRPSDCPAEIRRRVVRRAILALASEGDTEIRGRELDAIVEALTKGRRATLRGVLCTGGAEWRFESAPQRKLAR
jgi:tRNA(Ile)-lysidine synthase